MIPNSRTGWMFSEAMVYVNKPFEKFVTGCIVIGFVINVVVVGLLFTGVIKRPGSESHSKTQAAPAPTNWTTPQAAVSENTEFLAEKRG